MTPAGMLTVAQVGWFYSIVATPLAFSLILSPSASIIADPIYGYGLPEARLSALATGYFLWDLSVSAKHISTQGLGFFLHGAGCFAAFLFTLSPFLMFCGPNFLIVRCPNRVDNGTDAFRAVGTFYDVRAIAPYGDTPNARPASSISTGTSINSE